MLLGKDLFLLGLVFFMHFKYSLGTFSLSQVGSKFLFLLLLI